MKEEKKAKAGRKYVLKLYVTGQTPNSLRAITNLKKILAEDFKGVYELRIIDVMSAPRKLGIYSWLKSNLSKAKSAR